MIKFNNSTTTPINTSNTIKTDNNNNLKELNAVRSISSSSTSPSLSTSSDELKLKHSSSQSLTYQLKAITMLTHPPSKPVQLVNEPFADEVNSPTSIFQQELKTLQNDVNHIIKGNHRSSTFKKRSQSEPPLVFRSDLTTSRFLFDSISNRLSILNQIFIDASPTIKLLINNIKKKKYSNNHVYFRSRSMLLRDPNQDVNSKQSQQYDKSMRKKSLDMLLGTKKTLSSPTHTANSKLFINNFSCSMLVFKRSFSYTNLKYEQKYIKKSSSFEKFLQNVVKGKQKSISLCNFNSSSQHRLNRLNSGSNNNNNNTNNFYPNNKIKRENSLPKLIRSASITSNESDNLEQMMMTIMNNTSKNNWPVLKIEDSIKGSTNQLDDSKFEDSSKTPPTVTLAAALELKATTATSEQTVTTSSNIPDNVKSALESAGIDINQIIDMTNKLEKSFDDIDRAFGKKPIQSHLNADDKSPIVSHKELVTSHIRSVEISQNITTSISSSIENKTINTEMPATLNQNQLDDDDEDDVLKEKYLIHSNETVESKQDKESESCSPFKNNRKRLGPNNRRYATMANFTLPSSFSSHTFKTICALENFQDLDTINESNQNNNNNNINDCSMSNNSANLRFTSNRLPQSPSWASDICSPASFSSKILPAKYVSQFKPTLNFHKRTSTTPVANLEQFVKNSSSIDSFLGQNTEQTNVLAQDQHQPQHESSPIVQDEFLNPSSEQNIDLTKSLPNRNKKKNSVTRSLSYNIGNLIGPIEYLKLN